MLTVTLVLEAPKAVVPCAIFHAKGFEPATSGVALKLRGVLEPLDFQNELCYPMLDAGLFKS
jgi:hypothetical protein